MILCVDCIHEHKEAYEEPCFNCCYGSNAEYEEERESLGDNDSEN